MELQRSQEPGSRPLWTKARVLDELGRRRRAAPTELPRPLSRAASRHFGSLAAARRALAWQTHQRSLASLVQAILEMPIGSKLEVAERLVISGAVTAARGNKTEAARILGVHRKVIERVERRRAITTQRRRGSQPLAHLVAAVLEMPVENKLDEVERAMLLAAVASAGSNKSETARILGVHRKVVERRMGTLAARVRATSRRGR